MSWGVTATPLHTSRIPARARGATSTVPVVGPRCLVSLSSVPGGERITLAVLGEVDRDARDVFCDNLISALDASRRGVDLHLEGVSFWDCSALNALLEARRRAAADGKTVALLTASPVVRRVLELTDTVSLFIAPAQD